MFTSPFFSSRDATFLFSLQHKSAMCQCDDRRVAAADNYQLFFIKGVWCFWMTQQESPSSFFHACIQGIVDTMTVAEITQLSKWVEVRKSSLTHIGKERIETLFRVTSKKYPILSDGETGTLTRYNAPMSASLATFKPDRYEITVIHQWEHTRVTISSTFGAGRFVFCRSWFPSWEEDYWRADRPLTVMEKSLMAAGVALGREVEKEWVELLRIYFGDDPYTSETPKRKKSKH